MYKRKLLIAVLIITILCTSAVVYASNCPPHLTLHFTGYPEFLDHYEYCQIHDDCMLECYTKYTEYVCYDCGGSVLLYPTPGRIDHSNP